MCEKDSKCDDDDDDDERRGISPVDEQISKRQVLAGMCRLCTRVVR